MKKANSLGAGSLGGVVFWGVEYSGLEPLTSTLPVLRSTR